MGEHVAVEVSYTQDARQVVRSFLVPQGSSVAHAIKAFAIAELLPVGYKIDHVGIFGRVVTPDKILMEGDRIEIYRSLVLDPMEARRRRAR